MELKELKEIILNNEHVVEEFKNDFKVLTDYVLINDVMTLRNINHIKTVGDENTDNPTEINVWFNEHCIMLSDIKTLSIGKVRTYLK